MPRPTAITPDLADAIDYLLKDGPLALATLRRHLAAGGFAVSERTLRRYLPGRGMPAEPLPGAELSGLDPETARIAAEAKAVLDSDDVGTPEHLVTLRAAQRRIAAAMQEWEPRIGHERQAVLSYSALVKIAGQIAREIADLTPRPEADRYKPIEGEALRALLARAEAAAIAESGARERVTEYDRMIEDGTLTIGPGRA
ncbi:MAG TPA: hypothetical protein VGI10_02135 [Polyangiaceae bacterium]